MKKLFAVALLSVGMVSGAAQAGFVQTDWKVAGDKNAVLHEETGLEWLNRNITRGMSFLEVESLLDTVYQGWRLPSELEVKLMVKSFFNIEDDFARIEEWNRKTGVSYSHGASFGMLFGENGISSGRHYSYGMYRKDNGIVSAAGVDRRTYIDVYLDYHNLNEGVEYTNLGVWLVSDGGSTLSSIQDPTLNINNPNAPINQGGGTVADVSAPAGLFALLSGLFFFARRRG